MDTRRSRTPVGQGGQVSLGVLGSHGVPAASVGTVLLNVTAVAPTGSGFLTVWPAGQPRPTASHVNFASGRTVANLVVAAVGSGGQVSIYNSAGATHVVVDVLGWVPDHRATGLTRLLVPSATRLYGSGDLLGLTSEKGISTARISPAADRSRLGTTSCSCGPRPPPPVSWGSCRACRRTQPA